MKQYFTFLVLLTFYINNAQTFDSLATSMPNLNSSLTAFGDVDNDGDLDVYISGINEDSSLGGGLYIYDSGIFTLSTSSNLPLVSLGSVRFGDINNDGNLDLLIAGYDDMTYVGTADVYLNNADGTFTALEIGLPPMFIVEVAFADFDNDNFLDIALTGTETNSYSNISKLFHNNGDNTFSEITTTTLPGMSFGRVKFADYNNDTNIDFVLSGYGGAEDTYYTKIYTNDGNGDFEVSDIALENLWLGDTEWGDYDGDGYVDLAISGTGGDSGADKMTFIYKNNGDSTFTDIEAGLLGVSNSAIEWADFDGDNDLDLLVTGTYHIDDSSSDGHSIIIYSNDGNDVFSVSDVTNLVSSHYGDVDTGDFDNDGNIDIIITGFDEADSPATNVYINKTVLNVENNLMDAISIYPNPCTDKKLTINVHANGDFEVLVYSILGKVVFTKKISNSRILNLQNLSAGLYLVQLKSRNNAITKKIIIK